MHLVAVLTSAVVLLTTSHAGVQDAPPVVEAQMPLDLYREDGQPVEMSPAHLIAGRYGDFPFFLSIAFDDDGTVLGPPWHVLGRVALGGYCRNEGSGVRAVLISNSTGQVWSGSRITVRAGPRRNERWAEGFQAQPDLLAAMAAGGIVTLALQDDDGRLWNTVTIDILSPAQRDELYAANLEIARTTDPATVPVVVPPPPLQLVGRALVSRPPPPPPQPCP